MKQRNIILGLLLLIILGMGVFFATKGGKSPEGSKKDGENTTEYAEASSETDILPEGNTLANAPEGSTGSEDGPDSNVTPVSGESQDKEWHVGPLVPDKNDTSNQKQTATTEEEREKITFPHTISGSNLMVDQFTSYSGIYLEDGSDQEISDVAAIVVKNNGTNDVEYADITIERDKKEYHFTLSDLPAGKTAVVQEANKASYKKETSYSCTASVAEISSLPMSKDQIQVTENDNGSLNVKNLTGKKIPCVRVFYKFYMADENAFIGGITYTAKVEDLKADESRTVNPSHYNKGYSKVVMVRTYDSKS